MGTRGRSPSRDEELALRRRVGDRRMIGWFYRSLAPYWPRVLLGTTAMVLGVALELTPVGLMKVVFDDVIAEQRLDLLPSLVLALVGCYAGGAVLGSLRMATMHILAQRMVYDLRRDVHRHLQQLSLGYFESHSTGDIMSRLSNDVGAVENLVSHGTDTIIGDVLRIIGVVTALVLMLWKLALISLIPVPVFIVAIILFARKVRPYYERIRQELGDINAHLQENIAGIRVVQAFAREKHEEELFDRSSFGYYKAYAKGVWMWSTFFPAMGFLTSLSFLAIIWFGVQWVHAG
ncbi:MAG: hypothetical protein FJX74_20090, partial [Armatimonadetes bacterium]|nr:hypothetical protein [Armatimonadota bacterium]